MRECKECYLKFYGDEEGCLAYEDREDVITNELNSCISFIGNFVETKELIKSLDLEEEEKREKLNKAKKILIEDIVGSQKSLNRC